MHRLIAQLDCPVTADIDSFLATAQQLSSAEAFHLFNPGGGLHPLALGSLLQQELGKEIYLHLHPGDRNRAALFSDLITANALSLEKVILSVGPHPSKTSYPEAKPVFDIDLLQFLRMALRAREGFDPAGRPIEGGPLVLQIGAQAKVDSPLELFRVKQMADMGADFLLLKWPSSLLSLSQVSKEIRKPIFLSLELDHPREGKGGWQETKGGGIAGINLRVPPGQAEKGEEVLKWYSHYLSFGS
jgi:hypothetical protein